MASPAGPMTGIQAVTKSSVGVSPRCRGRQRKFLIPRRPPKRLLHEITRLTSLDTPTASLLYSRFRRIAPTGFMVYSAFKASMGMLALLDEPFLCDRLFRAFDFLQDNRLDFLEWGTSIAVMMKGTEEERLELSFRFLKPPTKAIAASAVQGSVTSRSKLSIELEDDVGLWTAPNPRFHSKRLASARWKQLYGFKDAPGLCGKRRTSLPQKESSLARVTPPPPEKAVTLPPLEEEGGTVLFERRSLTAEAPLKKHKKDGRSLMYGLMKRRSSLRKDSDLALMSRMTLLLGEEAAYLNVRDFITVVRALERTRCQLVGEYVTDVVPDDVIENIFEGVARSVDEYGNNVVSVQDFKHAVQNNPDFLALLGVQPGALLLPDTAWANMDYNSMRRSRFGYSAFRGFHGEKALSAHQDNRLGSIDFDKSGGIPSSSVRQGSLRRKVYTSSITFRRTQNKDFLPYGSQSVDLGPPTEKVERNKSKSRCQGDEYTPRPASAGRGFSNLTFTQLVALRRHLTALRDALQFQPEMLHGDASSWRLASFAESSTQGFSLTAQNSSASDTVPLLCSDFADDLLDDSIKTKRVKLQHTASSCDVRLSPPLPHSFHRTQLHDALLPPERPVCLSASQSPASCASPPLTTPSSLYTASHYASEPVMPRRLAHLRSPITPTQRGATYSASYPSSERDLRSIRVIKTHPVSPQGLAVSPFFPICCRRRVSIDSNEFVIDESVSAPASGRLAIPPPRHVAVRLTQVLGATPPRRGQDAPPSPRLSTRMTLSPRGIPFQHRSPMPVPPQPLVRKQRRQVVGVCQVYLPNANRPESFEQYDLKNPSSESIRGLSPPTSARMRRLHSAQNRRDTNTSLPSSPVSSEVESINFTTGPEAVDEDPTPKPVNRLKWDLPFSVSGSQSAISKSREADRKSVPSLPFPGHTQDAKDTLALVNRLLLWLDDAISTNPARYSSPVLENSSMKLPGAVGHFPLMALMQPNKSVLSLEDSQDIPLVNSNSLYSVNLTDIDLHQRRYTNPANFRAIREQAAQRRLATNLKSTRGRRMERKILDSGPRGLVVHFGHESWNMVLNMMVGIRLAAARASLEPPRNVMPYDFIIKEKFSILPKASHVVSKLNRYNYTAVRFIDYAPVVFRKLRESAGLQSPEYLRSVGPEQLIGNMVLGNLSSMSELCSEGKSGALFYYTADGRFLVKTMTKEAAKFFRALLPPYFDHVMANPGTLITRFHGFHAIRLKPKNSTSQKLYFVVMGNVFHTPVILHRRYDLKGSWIGRTVVGPHRSLKDLDPSVAMKDLDFKNIREVIKLGAPLKANFIEALRKDTNFLASQNILDYSLLFGIHVKSVKQPKDLPRDAPITAVDNVIVSQVEQSYAEPEHSPFKQYPWLNPDGMVSSDGKALYFCGIIDVFTQWTAFKKLEHTVKSTTTTQSKGISCVNPRYYASRFMEMMVNIVE